MVAKNKQGQLQTKAVLEINCVPRIVVMESSGAGVVPARPTGLAFGHGVKIINIF
jgi:hypothetical protein